MNQTDHDPAGPRQRVLCLSTFAFTLLFAVWLMLGVLGIKIRDDLTSTMSLWALPDSSGCGKAARSSRQVPALQDRFWSFSRNPGCSGGLFSSQAPALGVNEWFTLPENIAVPPCWASDACQSPPGA